MKSILKLNSLYLISTLLLMTFTMSGQQYQSLKLTPETYDLWGNLSMGQLSNSGKWVFYEMTYDTGLDTLYIQQTYDRVTYKVPKGYGGAFLKDEWFVCLLPEAKLLLIDLNTGVEQSFERISKYELIENQKLLLLFTQEVTGTSSLHIKRLKSTKATDIISGVTAYSKSQDGNKMAYSTHNNNQSNLHVLDFETGIITELYREDTSDYFLNLIWHKDDLSLVFSKQEKLLEPKPSKAVYYYHFEHNEISSLDWDTNTSLAEDYYIDGFYPTSLVIEDSNKQVFVMLKNKPKQLPQTPVEVWHTADPELGVRKHLANILVGKWQPKSGQVSFYGSDDENVLVLSGNQDYLITFKDQHYKPSYTSDSDVDVYLTDLNTQEKQLLIKQYPRNFTTLTLSPDGRFISYFLQGQWWVYSIYEKKHRILTSNIRQALYEQTDKNSTFHTPYGVAGWTPDSSSILIYDQFDIWQVPINLQNAKKLTQGREYSIRYRLVNSLSGSEASSPFLIKKAKNIDLSQSNVLYGVTSNHSKEGYFLFKNGKIVEPIFFDSYHLSNIRKSKQANNFVYLREQYDKPPALVYVNEKNKQSTLFQSNPHYKNYAWGHSKLIDYTNSKGQHLQGVLFYPFDFNPQQTYPVVVRIYERLTFTQHLFTNPSLFNSDGFNKTNYTSKGYFVFYPDIAFEIGNPGYSAADCVISATKTLLKNKAINPSRIGLIGHSFGGYESLFLSTQTNLFTTIVAGAGVADLSSCYFTFGRSYSKPETWRFEHGQMRMGQIFFDAKEAYYSNSPITHALNINTPVLSWLGAEDLQVDPNQSMYFYMAMRRLQKPHIMLRYKNEGHVLLAKDNQVDLSKRMMDWLDYYLKDEIRPDWINIHK